MINIIWAAMIIIGIVYSIASGNIESLNTGILDSTKEAVSLCITMLGIVSLWCGIMKIADKSGLMNKWTKLLSPVMKVLFPNLPADSKAYKYICTNIVANMIGLGWASTPPALKAMEELAKMNNNNIKASREMSVFLILNVSSLQLIPVSIIAYRAEYGAANPASIIIPGLIATSCSTLMAVLLCFLINKYRNKRTKRTANNNYNNNNTNSMLNKKI